jgi:putative ABC transport system permease protein
MSILMTLRIALKALNRNKMRTVLTMLGMIIGVGAVITMVGLGRGAQATIEEQVKSAGTNLINVNAGNFMQGGVRQGQGMSTTLTAEDAQALRDIAGVQYVAPGVNSRAQVIAGNQNWSTRVEGTDVDFPLMRVWPVKYGSFFTQQDVNSAAKVAVLGTVVAETLFGPDVDPTGQVIRIRNQPFKVIGVMASKGQGSFGQDQDDTIFTPYTTVQKKLQGIQHINNITVSSETPDTAPVAAAIGELLRVRHKLPPGEPDDFMVRTQEEIASVRTETTRTMTTLLAAIAGVRAARTCCSSSSSRRSSSACSADSSESVSASACPRRWSASSSGRRRSRRTPSPWPSASPPRPACSSGSIPPGKPRGLTRSKRCATSRLASVCR